MSTAIKRILLYFEVSKMTGDWLYQINLFLIILGMFLVLVVVFLIGYLIARKFSISGDADSQITTIQAATLGLLGLLLAFTFSMADQRYETRRHLVFQEANAIGTVYLRAKILPEPNQTQTIGLLKEYVEARLEFFDAGIDSKKLALAITKSEDIQMQLWQLAISISEIYPHSIPYSLFIESLNDMIDIHTARVAAMKNRVPVQIIDLILMSSVIAIGLMGYSSGMVRRRSVVSILLAISIIVLIVGVIIDLDRPRRGLIQVNQDSIIRLQQTIK